MNTKLTSVYKDSFAEALQLCLLLSYRTALARNEWRLPRPASSEQLCRCVTCSQQEVALFMKHQLGG